MNIASITILTIIVFQSTREAIEKQDLVNQFSKEAVAIELSHQDLALDQSRQFEISNPDIYYIILDGYGNSNMLNKYYELDISQFESYLTDRGFYISEKSNSNYSLTKLSLSSSLNMQYMDSVAKQMGNSSSNTVPLIQYIQNNILIDFLRTRGYTISAFESGYGATELTSADRYFNPKNTLTAFYSEIINLTPLRLWLSDLQYQTQRIRIKYIFDQLQNSPFSDHPEFLFAHVPAPHPPFIFGPNGESFHSDIPYSIFDGNYITDITGKKEYKTRYKNQVIYLNKLIETTIDEILNKPGPEPIIIIQGDHGPASELNWQSFEESEIDERMGILNAYYFPDRDYSKLYKDITPVNTFRIILNQYYGTNLELLEDRSCFSFLSSPYELVDVSEEIRPTQ
jgi:hypothetical protein